PYGGGRSVDGGAWRLVFVGVVPFALGAAAIASRSVRQGGERGSKSTEVDYPGAALVTLGLAGVVGALIAGPVIGFTEPAVIVAYTAGLLFLVAFFVVEQRSSHPLLPLGVFRSR